MLVQVEFIPIVRRGLSSTHAMLPLTRKKIEVDSGQSRHRKGPGGAVLPLNKILAPSLSNPRRNAIALGIVMGFKNPWVLPWVYLGYGSGYRHLYPHKTHTPAMGMMG